MEQPENIASRFKRGVYRLNDQSNFDFQLNRLIMWNGGDLDEVQTVSQSIHTSDDWKRTLIQLGDRAVHENRIENAIGYYRMSEFFMYDGDPDKRAYYEKATKLFYNFYKEYFDSGTVERCNVPYEDITLPRDAREGQGQGQAMQIVFEAASACATQFCHEQGS